MISMYTIKSMIGCVLAELFPHIPCQVATVLFSKGQAITHKPEPIPASVLEHEILGSELVQDFLVVNHTARVHSRYPTVGLSFLEPGPAVPRPNSCLYQFLSINIKIIQGILANLNGPV